MISVQDKDKTIENHNSLSFHLLRSKFQSSHLHSTKKSNNENDVKKKFNLVNSNTMPKRAITNNKKKAINKYHVLDISDQQQFPILKRNTTTTSIDINSDHTTTPSFWSSSNSSSITTNEEVEDFDHVTVPRTGSFINDLNKRLEQSEKKGESINHMIPKSSSFLTITSRKSAPPTQHNQHYSEDNTIHLPTTISMHHIMNRKSVPTSTSSPSLLKRSATITSIHSLASSYHSNTSSNHTSQHHKKNWFVPHWFNNNNHPQKPSSITIEQEVPEQECDLPVLTRSSAVKRTKVIQELLNTEKSYQTDMKLVKEIYYDTAHEIFSKLEMKQVFINLLDLLEFEDQFIELLELACKKDEYQQLQQQETTIGTVFNTMMNKIDHVYGDYCKKHEDSICKIQELSQRSQVQAYFTNCKEKIQGRTTCWDLPSLLIKPVQRVLKYPLLLKEILALTPEFHLDYDQLVVVTNEIQNVADHINEIKKRKDLVEQLIHKENNKNKLNKRFTRRVQRKKVQTEQGTQEILFDDIYKQFELKQELALQFIKDIQVWLQKIKSNQQSLADLVHRLDEFYGESDGIGLRSKAAFKKLSTQLSTYPLESLLEENVYNRINDYLKIFRNPLNVIEKRNRKLSDYHRCQYLMNTKGEIPDKQLQSSSEAYISLNAYLIDELPAFLSLTNSYFEIILDEYIKIQSNYWKFFMMEWRSLTIDQHIHKKNWQDIDLDYFNTINRLQSNINDIYTTQQVSPITNTSTISSTNSTVILEHSLPLMLLEDEHSLFSESKPLCECTITQDYISKENLKVYKDDIIQVWLMSNPQDNQDEWWYCSLKDQATYGWLPSTICKNLD